MRKKFTKEETWEAYSEEVIRCMIEYYNFDEKEAIKKLDSSDVKEDFLEYMEDYEFIEPERIARNLSKNK